MTTARNTTRRFRFYLNRSSNHSPFPYFFGSSRSRGRNALTRRIPVSCLVANGTRPVFSFLEGKRFLHPILSYRPSFFTSSSPPAGVCLLPPAEVSSGRVWSTGKTTTASCEKPDLDG